LAIHTKEGKFERGEQFFFSCCINKKWGIFTLIHRKLDRKYRSSAVLILVICLAISAVTLFFYLSETDFSDETLLWLLSILRISSFFIVVCSVYLLITCILNLIRKPSVLPVMGIFMFTFFTLYGACLIVLEAIIISITGGN